jgi:hypothetical protein
MFNCFSKAFGAINSCLTPLLCWGLFGVYTDFQEALAVATMLAHISKQIETEIEIEEIEQNKKV